MTIFLTTHYMEEAAKASHIAIIDAGHLKEYGTPFSLKEIYAKDKLRLYPASPEIEANLFPYMSFKSNMLHIFSIFSSSFLRSFS